MKEDESDIGDDDLRSRTVRLASMRKMPKVPDMSGKLAAPRRGSPFALDDFSSRGADTQIKP
jgi:hypothetical protein